MKYQLRDIFSDVIEAAKEAGFWQTMTFDEQEEIVQYFLRHFDSIIKEAQGMRISAFKESLSMDELLPRRVKGGNGL